MMKVELLSELFGPVKTTPPVASLAIVIEVSAIVLPLVAVIEKSPWVADVKSPSQTASGVAAQTAAEPIEKTEQLQIVESAG